MYRFNALPYVLTSVLFWALGTGQSPLLAQFDSADPGGMEAKRSGAIDMNRQAESCEPEGVGTDCNGNDSHDLCDLEFGISLDCDGNGIPDECEHLVLTAYEASDAQEPHLFGSSVSMDGDYAVVGDPGYDGSRGAVYVYERDEMGIWHEAVILHDPANQPDDVFGVSVSISGDTLIVGSMGNDADGIAAGTAFIYSRQNGGTWELVTRLSPDYTGPGDLVGRSVAISGDIALVSAHANDVNGTDSGAVHVFKRQSDGEWIQENFLVANNGSSYFGYSVAMEGDRAIIGSAGGYSGSAFIFRRTPNGTWYEIWRLEADDAGQGDFFGSAVSISNGVIIVTALGADETGFASGAAYVFSQLPPGNYFQMAKITPEDASQNDAFGTSVALSGSYALIGAIGDDHQGTDSGSVYIFERIDPMTWNQIGKLTAPEGGAEDYFGHAVALDGLDMLIGAPEGDTPDSGDAGNAYFGTLQIVPPCECDASYTEEEVKLVLDAPITKDYFGNDVAVDGELAVVGAAYDFAGQGSRGGSAVVFERIEGNWVQAGMLLPPDGQDDEFFGSSVSIKGERIAVGAIGDADSGFLTGAVHIYERDDNNEWQRATTLHASDAFIGDAFGSSVSLSENVLVVGALGADVHGRDSGAAYVFHRDSAGQWNEVSKLVPDHGMPFDQFGFSVATSGQIILIGAKFKDEMQGADSGAVYVYHKDEDNLWHFMGKLVPDDLSADDFLGQSVAVFERMALVGAPGDDDQGGESGAAYLFWLDEMSTWHQIAKLLPADGQPNDSFGSAVSLSDRLAVIGADGHFSNGMDSGATYVFKPDQDAHWGQFAKFSSSDVTDGDLFGASVETQGGSIVIGAHGDDHSGTHNAGAAYIYAESAIPWDCNLNRLLDECDIQTGFSLDENENGIPDECDRQTPPESEDCNGNAVPDEFENAPCVDCDINGNGVVKQDDLVRMDLCLEDAESGPCDQADLNHDGAINELDLMMMQQCLAVTAENLPRKP